MTESGISSLKGYPNPFQWQFILETENELTEIQLFDISGHELPVNLQKVASGYLVDAKDLEEGVYFVQTNLGVVQLMKHGE